VAYLVTSVLKDVLNRGTGASVRTHGFALPAAGKTGTSRDGWFAGYTSNLVCVIWIGFDDNRDLGLPGGTAAAPIWADFMLRATALPGYKNVNDFDPPEGVQTTSIDPESLELSTPNCPTTKDEVFVAGSAPTQYCELHGGGHGVISSTGSFLSHIFGGGGDKKDADGKPVTAPPGDPKYDPNRPPNATGQGTPPDAADPRADDKKKNPLKKIFGIFGGKKKPEPGKPDPGQQNAKPDNPDKGDSP
jgi:penicillin-binding protein 1B